MRLASLTLVAGLLILPAAAKADTFTDGFSTGTQGLGVVVAGNFTAIGGTNVDLLGASNGYTYLCSGVSACVDLGGSGGDPFGHLESNTVFGPGTYDVTFTLSGSQRAGYTPSTTVDVTFGSFSDSITTPSDAGATTYSELVTLTSPSTLDFTLTQSDNGNVGTILDSASVVSATPEPSSLVLLGSGLLSGAGMLFKRRKR